MVILQPQTTVAVAPRISEMAWTNGGAWFAHDDLLLFKWKDLPSPFICGASLYHATDIRLDRHELIVGRESKEVTNE